MSTRIWKMSSTVLGLNCVPGSGIDMIQPAYTVTMHICVGTAAQSANVSSPCSRLCVVLSITLMTILVHRHGSTYLSERLVDCQNEACRRSPCS